jgi:hypothetical protein
MAIDGALARHLDLGELAMRVTSPGGRGPAALRLAPGTGRLTGPDKYVVLDRRRRRAQIAARHLLALMDREAGHAG